jgi:hypothetical protein
VYSSANIKRMIKLMRMRWAGHVARMWENRNVCRILMGSQKEREHYEDLDVGGRVILKWTVEKYYGVVYAQ